MALHTYLPQDRLRALARGETLPDRTTGSALFADISGFTPLTEKLTHELGMRRGNEELSRQINAVYDALITEVEKYGGSVISFAGDAITCWFEEDDGIHAVSAALAMQAVIAAYPQKFGLKAAVTGGTARRFLVGDADIQLLDALAGNTIARLAVAEHLATQGEVLIDINTAEALGQNVSIGEWRTAESGERFALVQDVTVTPSPTFLPTPDSLNIEDLRPWILPAVFERQNTFLTELRPAVALFLRFTGIDYDRDEQSGKKLNTLIRRAQNIINRYEGALLQLIIGDKGSYFYACFGAPIAHEDDARRAVKAALELQRMCGELDFLQPVQIGISKGMMRTGAYGGLTRRTYGAIGDEIVVAARLMQTAAPGEILLGGRVQASVSNQFVFEPRAPLPMKGKAEPLPVFALTGARKQRAIRLQEPNYALPMVGRERELAIANDKLEMALASKPQVIGIVADAGMGKSRLVAEVIRLAHKKDFVGFGGACQSDAVNTPYLAWKPIWSALFGVDPELPLRKQIHLLEGEVAYYVPDRAQATPLLSVMMNLEIPHNDFTRNLEPQYRQSALRVLLEDCLRAATKDEPILIVIEDLHWMDSLSQVLLEELTRDLTDIPICFVLAYRPTQLTQIESRSNFTKIELSELTHAEAEQAIRAKLAQLYPARSGAVPAELVDKLMARAQGNPFFLEEMLNFLRDRGLDPRDPHDLNQIELPDSLHALILSRIDKLSEGEKTVLRVASIVGRLFRVEWLLGCYPELGDGSQVTTALGHLAAMNIISLDSPDPLTYLFNHIITHEVTYENLPHSLRVRLHGQLAAYLEKQIAAGTMTESFLLDTLVHHYTHSGNKSKQREYLKKAGQAALEVSAFNMAVECFANLLDLIPTGDAEYSVLALKLAEAYFRLSDFSAARTAIRQAQAAAMSDTERASAQAFLGEMMSELGNYAEAQTVLAESVPLARASGDQLTLCRSLYALGDVSWRLGKLDDAKVALDESLKLARALKDLPRELFALNRLGTMVFALTRSGMMGLEDLAEAERLFTEVRMKAVAVGNRERAMVALHNLSEVCKDRQDYTVARDYSQQALALSREIGAQQDIAWYLSNLADVDIQLGQLPTAQAGLREGLALALRLRMPTRIVHVITCFANLSYAKGQVERALELWGLACCQPVWNSGVQHDLDVTLARWNLDPSVVEAGLAKGAELDWDTTIQELLKEGK
jgi:class 3 adenylate cyclase/tetratricopeptide (TPR) repeat protein